MKIKCDNPGTKRIAIRDGDDIYAAVFNKHGIARVNKRVGKYLCERFYRLHSVDSDEEEE